MSQGAPKGPDNDSDKALRELEDYAGRAELAGIYTGAGVVQGFKEKDPYTIGGAGAGALLGLAIGGPVGALVVGAAGSVVGRLAKVKGWKL